MNIELENVFSIINKDLFKNYINGGQYMDTKGTKYSIYFMELQIIVPGQFHNMLSD